MIHHPWLVFAGCAALTAIAVFLGAIALVRLSTSTRPPTPLYILIVYFFAGAGIGFGAAWNDSGVRDRLRRLEETPRVAVKDLRPEKALVTGRVVAWKTFQSPLSCQPCVYCKIWFDHWHQGSGRRDSSGWRRVLTHDGWSYNWFEVDDGTGRVLVWSHLAWTTLRTRGTASGHVGDTGPGIAEFVQRAEVPWTDIGYQGQSCRGGEAFVQEGDTVTVVGTARPATDPGDPLRPEAPMAITGTGGDRLLLSDGDPTAFADTLAQQSFDGYILGGILAGLGTASLSWGLLRGRM